MNCDAFDNIEVTDDNDDRDNEPQGEHVTVEEPEEKSWDEKNGWEKTGHVIWEGCKLLGCVAIWALIKAIEGGAFSNNTPNEGNSSVWTVGSGQTKKSGSWSSGRHR